MATYPPPTEDLAIFDSSVFNEALVEGIGSNTPGSTDFTNLQAGFNIVKTESGFDTIISTDDTVSFNSLTSDSIIGSNGLFTTQLSLQDQDPGTLDQMHITRNEGLIIFAGTTNASKLTQMQFFTAPLSGGYLPQLTLAIATQPGGGGPYSQVSQFAGDITATGSIKSDVLLIDTVDVGSSLTTITTDITTINDTITSIVSQFTAAIQNIESTISNITGTVNGLVADLASKQQQLSAGDGITLLAESPPGYTEISVSPAILITPSQLNVGVSFVNDVYINRIDQFYNEGVYMITADCPIEGQIGTGTVVLYRSIVNLYSGLDIVMVSGVSDIRLQNVSSGLIHVNMNGLLTIPPGGDNIKIEQKILTNNGGWTVAPGNFSIVKVK